MAKFNFKNLKGKAEDINGLIILLQLLVEYFTNKALIGLSSLYIKTINWPIIY